MPVTTSRIPHLLSEHHENLTTQWIAVQTNGLSRRLNAAEEKQLASSSGEFLTALRSGMQSGNFVDLGKPEWEPAKDFLGNFSSLRARSGFSPSETAAFVLSLKEPLFDLLRKNLGKDAEALASETWTSTLLLDKLALLTTDIYQKSREEIISRQQQELLELSTPVVRLWDNIVALPLIGTLDSSRTQIVMQNLLQAIVDTRSDIAIIDITGVPTVDTLVAQHLLKTVAAARLMGADCIISGIRPQIAQTIIHLGVDLAEVTTKATLADAFALALKRTGHAVVARSAGRPSSADGAERNSRSSID